MEYDLVVTDKLNTIYRGKRVTQYKLNLSYHGDESGMVFLTTGFAEGHDATDKKCIKASGYPSGE
jgi:hypothetical protein